MTRLINSGAAVTLAVYVTAGFLIAACSPAPLDDVTYFEGARLIIGDGSLIENGTIVIDHAEIIAVGAAEEIEVPAGANRINLGGKTIMPTIVDTHIHVRQTPEELIQDLKRRAYFGVGAAMSLGLDSPEIVSLRDRAIPGAARFFSAGLGITAIERRSFAPYLTPYQITTEEEGRESVRKQAALGVDIIKIWVDDRNGKYAKLTPSLYGPIINEANDKGVRVTAHIFTLEDAKGLLRAKVSSFAHSIRDMDADNEVLELLSRNPDFVLVPNLGARGIVKDFTWLHDILPRLEIANLEESNTDRPKVELAFAIQARNLAKISDAGVTIGFGTDGNRPWGPHDEMEDMVFAGMTPMEVIVAATRNSADFLRMDKFGTLELGKIANFIVLDGNPLDDITNTRAIVSVYLNGKAVDRAVYP